MYSKVKFIFIYLCNRNLRMQIFFSCLSVIIAKEETPDGYLAFQVYLFPNEKLYFISTILSYVCTTFPNVVFYCPGRSSCWCGWAVGGASTSPSPPTAETPSSPPGTSGPASSSCGCRDRGPARSSSPSASPRPG